MRAAGTIQNHDCIYVIKRFQKAALMVAAIALAASAGLFWQFLSHGKVSGRAIIPSAEIQHVSGFRYNWHVPPELCAAPWYRAEVRILENSKPLPFRVEDSDAVSSLGNGRFGVSPFSVGVAQKEFAWFSASDNSDPVANGRSYEFEMRRTVYRYAILSAIAVAISILAAFAAVLAATWSPLVAGVTKPGHARLRLLRRMAAALAVLAVIILAQSSPRTRISARINFSPSRLIQSGDYVFYRLPPWVGQEVSQEFLELSDNGKPMKRSSSWAWKSGVGRNSFYCSSDFPVQVYFYPADGSNAAVNGRTYTASVPLFPPQFAPRLAVLMAVISLLLFICAPELAIAPAVPKCSRFVPWMRSSGWRWAILIVGLFKLWVTARDEVLAQVYDAHGYAQSAAGMVWGAGMTAQPSGFSMVAGIVAQFGVPWRLALEILYLGACGFLAGEIISLLGSRMIGVLLFTAMVWHPWTLSGFHDFWTYPFVLLLSVALLAVMFRVLRRPSSEWTWPIFAVQGLILFFWEWSRTEDPLVFGTWALFAGLAWMLTRQEINPVPWRRKLALLALPLMLVIALSTGVRIINYFHYGVFAKSRMAAPGLTALMKALYRIKPERDLRYAPVTHASLELACEASPTLRQFKNALLDTSTGDVKTGAALAKAPGEVGSWLNMQLLHSFNGETADANQAMLAAASEINDALRDGRLPKRNASYPLDPNWRMWLPDLAPSFVACLRSASSVRRWKSWEDEVTGSPYLDRDFDLAANRRAASADSSALVVDGAMQLPMPLIDSVGVADQHGRILAASPFTTNSADGGTVFYLRAPLPKEQLTYNLVFFQEGKLRYSDKGHDAVWWATNQYPPVTNSAVLSDSGEKIIYTYNLSASDFDSKGRMESWEPRAEALCKIVIWAAVIATFLIALSGKPWDKIQFQRVIACLALVTGWLIARAALYALIDANMAYTVERYMRCVSPLFVLILVLAASTLAAFLKSALRKTSSHQ